MPTLGYYASPTYLNMVAADGCISKVSKSLMYGQITALAKSGTVTYVAIQPDQATRTPFPDAGQ